MKKNYFSLILAVVSMSISSVFAQATKVVDIEYPSGSFVSNQNMYTCTQGGKIYYTDLSLPTPTPVLVFSSAISIGDVMLMDYHVVFTDYTMGNILRHDLSSPSLFSYDTLVTGVLNATKLFKDGDDLYVTQADQSKISKIDLSQETLIAEEVVSDIPGAWGISKYGNDLYVASINMRAVYKVDLTQNTPTTSTYLSGLDQLTALEIMGDKLYVAEYRNGNILELDLTNALAVPNTVLTGAPYIYGLYADGSDLYLSQLIDGKVSVINDLLVSSKNIKDLKIGVYPNPTEDLLFTSKDIGAHTIHNLLGKKVSSGHSTLSPIDVSDLNRGTYFLNSKSGYVFRFVKK